MKKLVVTVVALGAIIWWLTQRVDLTEAWTALGEAHWQWLVLAVVVQFTNIYTKGVRWAFAIEGAIGERPRSLVFRSTMMGFAGNFVMPARMGELLRAAILHRHNPGVGYTRALASAALTQFFDLIYLLCILAGFALMGVGSQLVSPYAAMTFLAAALGALVVVFVFAWRGDWVEQVLDKLLGDREGLPARIKNIVHSIHDSSQLVRNPRFFAPIFGLSTLCWIFEISTVWCGMLAFGIDASPSMAGLTMVALALSFALPITPGNVGTHQVVSVLVLGYFGIAESTVLAFSIGLHFTIALSIIGVGGVMLAMEGMGLKELQEEIEAEKKALARET
ncbi:MAG: flippase-like domain-containing protein [Chrysiogenetes bacterium]|nr:flippase-like domain-containing protein [Chrysiogenetes bacterium]